jgi:hypothetical protein
MTELHRLTLFLEAPKGGGFRLVTSEGAVVLERSTYQRLRHDLRHMVAVGDVDSSAITVLVGRQPLPRPR